MRQRAREAASEALLEAAEEVAAQRGLEAASIAAIAERAGVAVGTIYNYFPDRDALIAALFKWRRYQLLPRIAAASTQYQDLPFEAHLTAYLTAILAVFEEYRRFLRVAMSAEQNAARLKGRSIVLATIVESLRKILAPVAGEQSADLAHMLYGAMKALLHDRIERDEPLLPAAALLAATFLKGILPR